jgi:hypothetical protein
MKPLLISLAGVAALVGVGLALHAGLATQQDSSAAVFLRDKCGHRPESVQAPFDSADFINFARVSLVMTPFSEVELADAVTKLSLFRWNKNDGDDAYAEAQRMAGAIDDQVDAMVIHAAQCGAAYGIAQRGG